MLGGRDQTHMNAEPVSRTDCRRIGVIIKNMKLQAARENANRVLRDANIKTFDGFP